MLLLQCVIKAGKAAGHRVWNGYKLSENDNFFQNKVFLNIMID